MSNAGRFRRGLLFLVLFLSLSGAAVAQPRVPDRDQERVIIGDAVMEDDGTIVVRLRRTADGIHVSGTVSYRVDSPHYKEVLNHLGGMKPGETKLVPAWDDPEPKMQ